MILPEVWMTGTLPLLASRQSFPAEFRLILAELSRTCRISHCDFNGMAAFWPDRHLGFRQVPAPLRVDAEARIDRKLAPYEHARRLAHQGSGLPHDLIGHHQIEDEACFPELARLEPRISRGFAMLDADHHALHALIEQLPQPQTRALCT